VGVKVKTMPCAASRGEKLMKYRFYFQLLLASAVLMPPIALPGQTYTESVIYSFCAQSNCPTGSSPQTNLIQASDGNYYGTAAGLISGDVGTLFRLTPQGQLSVLHTFCALYATNCPQGESPNGIIEGSDGYLYGTTQYGGSTNSGTGTLGGGVLFKISLAGAYYVIYSFCSTGTCSSADYPYSTLVEGSDGNYYGTTSSSVFKITPSGQLTDFSCCAYGFDFGTPDASALLQATDGNYYGLASAGGNESQCNESGCGTIFRVTSGGGATSVYIFSCTENGYSCPDGAHPYGSLVETGGSNLYGLAQGGGDAADPGYGVIFKFSSNGSLTPVYTFCQTDCLDGEPPEGLMVASDGNIYGTTTYSGNTNQPGAGTVFRITPNSDPSASFETLYSFDGELGSTDADVPLAGVMQGSDGNLYGTTSEGGTGTGPGGTVYKLTVSPLLPAPVQLSLNSSQVQPGKPVTASLKVLNAFSLTMQQCYAFQNGTPLGKVPGTYSSSTQLYTFSGSLTPATAGIYNYAVTCGGVESGFATLTVGDTTSTTLTASPNPVTPPANVTLTATVARTTGPGTPTGGSGTPTGSVTFSSGTVVLGKASLNGSGVASLSAISKGVAAGTYPVVATYSGDTNDVGSASAAVDVSVE